MSASVTVQPVQTRGDWRLFYRLPEQLQAADPCWIKPLHLERKSLWSARNPWFQHATAQAFIARRGDQVVGRISAQVDTLEALKDGQKLGYFGQFECSNDHEVAGELLATAAQWVRRRGCGHLRGPYDLGINQSCGLLVEGQDSPPMLMMGHAPRYYQDLVEVAGLSAEMDLLAYLLPPDFAAPPAMQRLLRSARGRIVFRSLDFSRFKDEVDLLRDLFNDAWAGNWGFVPVTEAEFRYMGSEMRKILKPAYTSIAEVDGEAAGFIIALPNLNELIADLDGRLFPAGWAKLLWRLARGRARSARVPLMGVRRRYQRGAIGAAVSFGMIDGVRRALHADGIDRVEVSWILQSNQGMNAMIDAMGGQLYKRYRLYGRVLN